MKLYRIGLVCLLLLLPLFAVAADDDIVISSPVLTVANQQLAIEQARNALLSKRLQVLQTEKQGAKVPLAPVSAFQHANIAIALAQSDVDNINLALSSAQQALAFTQDNIESIDNQRDEAAAQNSSPSVLAQYQTRSHEQHELLDLQQKRVKLLQQSLELAQQTLLLAQDWQNQLQTLYHQIQHQLRQYALDQQVVALEKQQQAWLNRLHILDQQLAKNNALGLEHSAAYAQLAVGILQAEEQSNLSEVQLNIAKLHNRLEDLSSVTTLTGSLNTLNATDQQLALLIQQLKELHSTLENKISLLKKRNDITSDSMKSGALAATNGTATIKILNGLLNSYQAQLETIKQLEKQARSYQETNAKQLNQQLASRQGLPGFSSAAWLELGSKLVQIPEVTWRSLNGASKSLVNTVLLASTWQWLAWGIAILVWLIAWNRVPHYLDKAVISVNKRKQRFFAPNSLIIFLKLLSQHWFGISLLATLYIFANYLDLSFASLNMLLGCMLIIVSFRLAITLSRLVLLDKTSEQLYEPRKRVFAQFKWGLRLGGFFTAIVFFIYQLPLAYNVQDLFGRFLMLFLLIVCIRLIRNWQALQTLVASYLENKRQYIKQAVRWLTLLIPLSLLSTALIGLVGYVELAWTMATYQGWFLVVMTGYLVARGLIGEFMRFIANQMIRYLRNGWLWSEALLKPFHQIIKIVLFVSAVILLFSLYGWGKHSWVVESLTHLFNYHLVAIAGSEVTALDIVELVLVILVIVWAARWSREFAYRWLFARTKDLGLRNSLAIFIQYATVMIGIFVCLRILGITVTALTVIASAFALGAGWGLRDLANNFVSGLLLLIERPVRVGDWVTIGDREGEVVHIGMRSITVTTDDHQELLVPNADVFSKTLINWTHRDSVVRCLVTVKAARIDDPHRVRTLITEVLKTIPKILTNPAVEVYLRQIDSMLLEFRIGFYVDMRSISSRSEMCSNVMFSILDRFKAEGIHPPDVSHEIILKPVEEGN